MKRLYSSLIVLLSLAGVGRAQVFDNVTTLLAPTNIVASIVLNRGVIDFVPIVTNFNTQSNFYSDQIFMTHQTKYWTNFNNGIIAGEPGFGFFDVDSHGYQPSLVFDNAGLLETFSIPVEGYAWYGTELWPPSVTEPAVNGQIADSIAINANTVVNTGTIQVGDIGGMQITGQNVELNNGTLLAGTVDDNPTNVEATMDRGSLDALISGGVLYPAFSPPADVYDLFWTVTNSENFNGDFADLSDTYQGSSEVEILDDMIFLGSRNGTLEGVNLNINGGLPVADVLPMSGFTTQNGITFPAGNWVPYVLQYSATTNPVTNYVAVVLVNTAFADTNIAYQVGVFPGTGDNVLTNQGPDGFEYMVRFSSLLTDVATGDIVTNSIYVLDSGAEQTPAQDATNVLYLPPLNEAKPTSIEITRNEPIEWEDWLAEQSSYPFTTGLSATQIEDLLYTSGESMNETGGMTNVAYGAMIGRNPEDPTGLFPFTKALLGNSSYDIPDITNEPAQIQINASKNLNLNGMTLRANGVATISAPTITGSPAATDFGDLVGSIGAPKANFVLSNLVPSTFTRLRGDILCWSASWLNVITNDGNGGRITNTTFYHILVVDQDLRSTFKPSSVNLSVSGNNVTVDDQLNVIRGITFNAANLTLNNALNMTGTTPTLVEGNMPGVRNLTIGANGSISADSAINLGVPISSGPVNPLNTPYQLLSITNDNVIQSGAVQLQAANFANAGNVIATSGEIIINSKTNLMGGGVGAPNALVAGSDIELYSGTIELTNTTILAGQSVLGHVVLSAANELTDFHPNTASTGVYPTNIIQVSSGFSLPVKPTKGDLFGTEIISIAAGNRTVQHTWSGTDLGPTATGFFNNSVIGHLVLDRTGANATMRFSASGKKNAMYVDYLDLEDLALNSTPDGITVDPNLTIYFASANVDPIKLNQRHTNIVWVPSFAGPNSSTVVPYLDGSTCLMNATLAVNSQYSSDLVSPNSGNPYPLNSPDPYVNAVPCPSLVTSTDQVFFTNSAGNALPLVIWTTGEGSVTPVVKAAKPGQILNLTAVPAKGWVFLDWSAGVSSTSPTISFMVPSGTNAAGLSANFVLNVLPQLAGSYNGLFANANVQATNSGFISFSVSSTGAASGRAQIGSSVYPFATVFNGAGAAMTRATNGTNVVTVSLQLDTTNLTDQATGSVANGIWESPVQAYRTQTTTAGKPAAQAGYYTMALSGDPGSSQDPGGDSYGTLTVSAQGTLSAVGTLADGVAVSQSVPVSKEGNWPLYFSPAPGEVALGWVQFGTIGFGGTVHWFKAPSSAALYPGGFATADVLTGDRYVPAANGGTGLNYSSGTVNLTGGNLGVTVASDVTLSGKVTFQNASTTLTANPKTGTFTGSYQPSAGAKITFNGVVLPNEQKERGFFLGSSQSGEVLLQDQ